MRKMSLTSKIVHKLFRLNQWVGAYGARWTDQYLADVNRESEDTQRRIEDMLFPDAQEIRERLNATQVTTHERLFPFSDNLTTLIFTVACGLSEAQKERLTSCLSLQGVNVTVYTFEAVRTVFVELSCTSEKFIRKPVTPSEQIPRSLRQNLHRRRLCWRRIWSRSHRRSNWRTRLRWWWRIVFWTWDNNEYAWKSRKF